MDMMAIRRRVMSQAKKSILPKEYQQVEYIESSHTQWIDTGIYFEKDDSIDVVVRPTEYALNYHNYDRCVFGCYANSLQTELGIWVRKFRFDVSFTSNTINDNTYHVVKSSDVWTLDNEIQGTGINRTNTTHTIILFGRWYNGIDKLSDIRVYSYKHIRNNAVILDLIPCYRKADGEIGMYDTVSKTFYTNAGTGTFTKGADV